MFAQDSSSMTRRKSSAKHLPTRERVIGYMAEDIERARIKYHREINFKVLTPMKIPLLPIHNITSWPHAPPTSQIPALVGFSRLEVVPTSFIVWVAVLNQ